MTRYFKGLRPKPGSTGSSPDAWNRFEARAGAQSKRLLKREPRSFWPKAKNDKTEYPNIGGGSEGGGAVWAVRAWGCEQDTILMN